MHALARAVNIHKQQIKRLIYSSDVSLIVKLPVPTSSTGNPLFGDMTREGNEAGVEKGPFYCLWYDALSAKTLAESDSRGMEQIVLQSTGQFKEATSFAELWLDDLLINKADPAGQTWIDKAQYVASQGQKYSVLGYAKLGLSTSSPYILIVALKGGLGYVES